MPQIAPNVRNVAYAPEQRALGHNEARLFTDTLPRILRTLVGQHTTHSHSYPLRY